MISKKNAAHWIRNIEDISCFTDPEGAKLGPRKVQRGYICSNCGKLAWAPKETCPACNANMCKYEIDIR